MSTHDQDNTQVAKDRFTDPKAAIDHLRAVARKTAVEKGYRAVGDAVLDVRREYRMPPARFREAPPERYVTWQAIRSEGYTLINLAWGAHEGVEADATAFDHRVASPADQSAAGQPSWAHNPMANLQTYALRAQEMRERGTAAPRPPLPSPALSAPGDRTPGR